MRLTYQHCREHFHALRADARYCSPRCRTAASRQRLAPLPQVCWDEDGKELRFSTAPSRTRNADGTLALTLGELGERLLEIAHNDDEGKPKTGRRYYYLALSHAYIQPDMSDTAAAKASRDAAYDRVTDALGKLRKMGRLDWDMVLDLTRELDQWQTYASPREARAAMRENYDEDRWLGQPYYPLLIVEKDTLEPVCRPMAMRWQMPFASSRGYGSLSLQHEVARVLRARRARHDGQDILVYFVSDLDPSGLDLQRAWEEAFLNFGVVARFKRIALTPAQVATHRLARLSIEVKPSDSRARKFIAEHGNRCWEADVLPAAVIERAIDRHIASWLDGEAWERRAAEIEQARRLL
jgi:hypothetical protein